MRGAFDAIVIGSGFGGAIVACRLAEKGARVLVLERGRRWKPEEYPREPGDAWFYDPEEPHRRNGWIDLRLFPNMAVVQGAGVGGGSLIYANVSVEAKPEVFEVGWPREITYAELKPYYDTVGRMLNVQELPGGQLTERFKLMREGAAALGYADRFRKLPLAVSFDPSWSYDLEDAQSPKHSRTFTNEHGQKQGTCVHLGLCDIGCPVKAKNTLDLNYLARAEERHGVAIRPLHVVTHLEPEGNRYRVHFHRIEGGRLVRGSEVAERIVLAAGSLGSTELLLRSRDQYRTLPRTSAFLGRNWSSNGDFLTPAFYKNREIHPWKGPTITSAIDFLDGAVGNRRYFIEDGGFPDLAGALLRRLMGSNGKGDANGNGHGSGNGHVNGNGQGYGLLAKALRQVVRDDTPFSNVMPWFAQGIDAGDGRLRLGRTWYAPWKRRLKLDWEIPKSRELIDRIVEMHVRLAETTHGEPRVPPTWKHLLNLITPHPLGGCNVGDVEAKGVVNHKGEVFNYRNLYVADGAIIPEAVGLNPSRTIAALAERIAKLMG